METRATTDMGINIATMSNYGKFFYNSTAVIYFLNTSNESVYNVIYHMFAIICGGYYPRNNSFIYHCDDVTMDNNTILLKWR